MAVPSGPPLGRPVGRPYGSGGGSSLLKRMFGAKAAPAEADPVPGIGGYIYPRGPAGETGYPGSTSSRRTNPSFARKNTFQENTAPWNPIEAQQAERQDTAGEFHGGLPKDGTLSATGVGPQYQDTEQRSNTQISQDIPGGQNQRNTRYYGGINAIVGLPASDGSGSPNRYVMDGVNGGYEMYSMERRMPYTGHGTLPVGHVPHVRGADLNGIRFTMPPPIMEPQRNGVEKPRLRGRGLPTVFVEPAPWSANSYVTTAATGGPNTPGTAAPPTDIRISPAVPRANNWRRGG